MIDVPTTNWLSLTPYLGYGTKHNYIQYLSSATGWHFYNHTQESLFDAGIDVSLYHKMVGLVIGASIKSNLQVGAMFRY